MGIDRETTVIASNQPSVLEDIREITRRKIKR
jgi:hypothetical protein